MPLEHPTGPSYMSYGVVECPMRRHACPGCAPPPSWTAPPPAPGGGKQTRLVYTEGILLWVWPGCCSKVFLWADLT